MNSAQKPVVESVPAIVTTHIIPVSKELLFEAYTNPEILAQWWGPKGFTNTFHSFDLRPDGLWSFTMYGPDSKAYKNKIIFKEIVSFEKIVFHHDSGPDYWGVVTFTATDTPNHTQLTYAMTISASHVYQKLKDFIIGANEENFDRLEETLDKLTKN
ncbi:SRPBCC domain-containing protein [Emticicia agri]|uniref:Polyketide cyclase n=1 Tax=Emticicia agri TaxID=2492393 RepID=A0A4Q5LUK6_9BACT|nr:SRPBCC domain-containing protein [Emticicia agri]RYU93302.1 polyketide cyclase [Emticicia agri]